MINSGSGVDGGATRLGLGVDVVMRKPERGERSSFGHTGSLIQIHQTPKVSLSNLSH